MILEELNQTMTAFRRAGGTPTFIVLGKKQCRELAWLEPANAFRLIQSWAQLKFSDDEDILEVG